MATGMRTTFTDANVQREVITDMIRMIDWTEAGLLQLLGVDNESNFNFVNFPGREYFWLEDTMPPVTDVMNDSGGISNSDTSMVVTNGDYFRVGDLIQVDSEIMWVSAVSTNTLTIVRSIGSPAAASHADASTISIIGNARLEGAEATIGYTTTASQLSNVRQILETTVKVSGTQQVIKDYGIDDTLAYHLAKAIGGLKVGTKNKAGDLAIRLSKSFYYNYKEKAATNAAADVMGGFNEYVSTNNQTVTGELMRDHIYDAMQACFDDGGAPDTLVVGTFARRKISQMFDGIIRQDRSEREGGRVIDTLVTDFGDINVVWDRWCPSDSIYLIEPAKMGWVTIRPFDVKMLPATGDYEWSEVVGEYGFVLCNEKAHAKISGFSTSY